MATNEFLIFDEEAENMLVQAVYAEDEERLEGFKTGLARSNITNKALYQVTKMCHTFGEILKDNDYNASDSMTVSELKNAILGSLSADAVLQRCYPVGSIYMSVNTVDPATLFGFGTWEQIKDTFLLACGDTYDNGSTGGASTVTLATTQIPAHKHTASSDSKGAHTHGRGTMDIKGTWQIGSGGSPLAVRAHSGAIYNVNTNAGSGASGTGGTGGDKFGLQASKNWSGATESKGDHTHTITVDNAGGGQAHNNMPPYLAVNVWKRVA